MPLNLIRNDQFTTVLGALNDPNTIYLIPNFQRPYAWSERQINDLFLDMEKASKQQNGYHYLAALHLISVNPNDPKDPLADFIDYQGIGHLTILQNAAKNDQLETQDINPVKIYAVVDGQQRLTTLFFLAHLYYFSLNGQNLDSNLYVTLVNGQKIPRLIQSPADDHNFMMSLVGNIWASVPIPSSMSQSQKRMQNNFKMMQDWATDEPQALSFLKNKNFKTSAIELDAGYGLTSFMTLNDRGKPLTVLEKLKSLLLQFAFDAQDHRLIAKLHTVFGTLYRILDDCLHSNLFKEKSSDDEMVKLLSCYLRLDNDCAAIEQGADVAYENFFRHTLLETDQANISAIIQVWCTGIDEVSQQLQQLNHYLNGSLNGASIHFHAPASLSGDYQATIISLGLQPHILALLLKFRALYNKEWHDRFPIQAPAFSLTPIQDLLNAVRQRAIDGGASTPPLIDYIDNLLVFDVQPKSDISMLEVVERMQVFDWNLGSKRYYAFMSLCKSTFNYQLPAFIEKWLEWRSSDSLIKKILYDYADTNFKFLLTEYERKMGGNLYLSPLPQNVSTSGIELEHIFARNIDGDKSNFQGFPYFGINDRYDYDQNVLWRSGNLSWLSETANKSLGNKTPDIKGADYCNCNGHPNGSGNNACSNIAITKKLGDELTALGANYPAMRFYIEARCAELALFAACRFC
jgi:hypothetical protein